MKTKWLTALLLMICSFSDAQTGWRQCNSPGFSSRADDIFMVNAITGYAVAGDGTIMKTVDGGENWVTIAYNNTVYCRSIEFVNERKGFVGGFPNPGTNNILRRTNDGGTTWTDLTSQLHPRAKKGICGLAAPDSNTIYGGGNWYQDSAYIIKSTDGGNSWNFIDMSAYATSIIDLNFTSKDTGFATGKSLPPTENAIILYTTNGGSSWSVMYDGGFRLNEYCWKIQRLTPRIYFASIQNLAGGTSKILRSIDGGMTWKVVEVGPVDYNIQGVGFIDPLTGWTGGWAGKSFETKDGGKTWDSIPVCPFMNRVFRVNDTMMLASGSRIWKCNGTGLYPAIIDEHYASMKCHPNPVGGLLTINIAIAHSTHVSLALFDVNGRRIKVIDNAYRPKGSYHFYMETGFLPEGNYYVVLMTHEDKEVTKILIRR